MLQLDEPLLSPQYSSLLSPFHRRESDGIWNGLETDLERTYSGGSTEVWQEWMLSLKFSKEYMDESGYRYICIIQI